MIIQNNTAKSINNIDNDENEFKLKNTHILMQLLSKLYANPIRTLTQEYLCNARDAIRELGTDKRIEVITPNRLNPTLVIRDYGVGLSPQRVKDIFLNYGESTKKSTNGQTGGFGIGAKSAFAYTDNFTIESFYNGKKYTYIANSTDGKLTMPLMETIDTTEKNGVKIYIPVKINDIDKFRDAVNRTVFFWDDKEKPLINGELFKNNFKSRKESNNLYLVESNELNSIGIRYDKYNNNCLLVIDGIPYQIDHNILNSHKNFLELKKILKRDTMMLFKLNNGTVEIAPNREEIVNSDQTNRILTELFLKELNNIKDKVNKFYLGCKTVKDHLEKFKQISNYYITECKFKNYRIAKNYNTYLLESDLFNLDNLYAIKYKGKNNNLDKSETTYIPDFNSILTGHFFVKDIDESMVKHNQRLRETLNDTPDKIYLYTGKDYQKLIDDLGAIPLSSVALPIKNKNTVKVKRDSTKFCIHNDSYRCPLTLNYGKKQWVTLKEITNKVVYSLVGNSDYKLKEMERNSPDYIFIKASKTTIDKFLKDSKAIDAETFKKKFKITEEMILNHFKYNINSLGDFTGYYINKNYKNKKKLSDEIKRKDIKQYIEKIRNINSKRKSYNFGKEIENTQTYKKLMKEYGNFTQWHNKHSFIRTIRDINNLDNNQFNQLVEIINRR